MIDPNTQTCIVIIVLEVITGLCSNVFIIRSLILTSIKDRSMASCNCLLISLSVSNVYFTIISSVNFLINYVWPSLFRIPSVFHILYYMTLCGITSSSWLTASLCFFYFIKIQHFQPGILAWVRMKIDKIVPWLIVTAELISVSGGFLSLLIFRQETPKNSTNPIFENFEQKKSKLTLINTSLIINSLAFLVGIMSTSSSLWFLKVQRSAGTFGSTKVRDYQSAVQTMVRLVVFYAVFYLVMINRGLEIFPNMSWGYWVCMIILFSFALVQSGLLIHGNPKLREAWRQLFTIKSSGGLVALRLLLHQMKMPSLVTKVFSGVIALEVIVGLCSNAFIISSLTLSGFQRKSIAPYNHLLIALNASNMCFTIFMSVYFLMYFLWPSFSLIRFSSVLNYLTFSRIASNSWLTAGLCCFYFIKIVQFQSRFLVWLKNMMDRRMPMLIIIVECVSLFESFTALYIFNQDLSKNSTITANGVASEQNTLRMKFMGAVLTLTSPPFLISIFTTAASAVSLKLHNDRMKTNMGHTKVRDYQSAVETMAGLVVFYALIYFVTILYSQKIFEDLSLGYWICVVILSAFSVVQSGLHIIGNPKLKETLRKIFTFS